MTLVKIQKDVCAKLRQDPWLCANNIPVLAEDEGNVLFDRDAAFAGSHLAVTVGAAEFEPKSRSAHTPEIYGMARFTVKAWEQPSRNRVGQGRTAAGPCAAEAAEAVACAAHRMIAGGGVVVCTGIGGVERPDADTVRRPVGFEILAKLSMEDD